jgi:hypothetical protein
MEMVMAKNQRAYFAAQITAEWRKSLQAILGGGRKLIVAKDKLDHGEFAKMAEHDLPFGLRTAQRLMAIARDKRLTKATHASLLPSCWTALYALTSLSDSDFDAAIDDGLITPDISRDDVCEIAARYAEASCQVTNDGQSRRVNMSFESTEPAPQSLATMRLPAAPITSYKPDWPARRPTEDRVETMTAAHLDEIVQRGSAARILESLLTLDRESRHGVVAIATLLLDPANREKLDRVRRGISFAIRVKGALDQAGLRGNPTLRLIEENS